jgi:predicted ester cyclase
MSANRTLLERYVDLYNQSDLDACMDLYAEDAVQLMHDGIFEGRREIHERVARDLSAFPDATYTVASFVEQGDLFADEWTFAGTNTGPFRLPDGTDVPPTGRPMEIKGMELVQVREGKIIVDNLYYDFMAGLIQLGLVPEGAVA